MAINIVCDKCGRSYSVKPELAGRKVQCKGCGNTFVAAEPQPELVELTELGDLSSFNAGAGVPLAELSSGGLTSQALAPQAKRGSDGFPKGLLIALVAGGGAAVVLVLVVVMSILLGGKDEPVAGPGATDPANAGVSSGVAAAPGGAASSTGAALPVTAPTVDKARVPWSVSPDPAPALTKTLSEAPLATGNVGNVFFARRDAALALACKVDYSTAGGVVHAEKFDLAAGRSLGAIDLPVKDRVLNVSADGASVLAGSNGSEALGFETLRVWSWTEQAAQEAAAWNPYPSAKTYKTKWAAMPRGDLILTLGNEGELAGWSFPNPQQKYLVKIEGQAAPLLTPGGKYVAVRAEDAFRFYETATGKPAGQSEAADGLDYASAVAVHPSGDRLAALCPAEESASGWKAYVWDLKTGKVAAESDVVDPLQTHIQFCEAPFLLAGNTLIDLERGASVWRYRYSNAVPDAPDTRLWFTRAVRSEYRTYAYAIPSAEDRTKIDAAWNSVAVVVAAGESLSIEVAVPADAPAAGNQQALVEKAAKKLQETGYQPAADQPRRLRVTVVEGGSGQMIEFRSFSRNQIVAQIPDKKLELKVAIVDQAGKEVWSRSSYFGPTMMTHLKPDEMADPAKAILSQRWTQLAYWLDSLKIPPEIRSNMTEDGIGRTEIKPM